MIKLAAFDLDGTIGDMSGGSILDYKSFYNGLKYVGSPLKIASIISLVVSILFLAYGIYQDIKKVQAYKSDK